MTSDDYNFFSCIVAGDNPEELIAPYDKNKKEEPYVLYRPEDAGRLRLCYINIYSSILSNPPENCDVGAIRDTLDDLTEMNDEEFFMKLTEGRKRDEATGNIISDENRKGKYSFCRMGKMLSVPFLTKDGKETFQARKGDIDWGKIHHHGQETYRRAWEMVMEKSEPADEHENAIYTNMKNRTAYFLKFGTKENYVLSCTAFWSYAFVSDKTGWLDASGVETQFAWMREFYDLFIKNLPDDTLLTIYECTR